MFAWLPLARSVRKRLASVISASGEHRADEHENVHTQLTVWMTNGSLNARGASLVRCTPRTGRTHQIRVHLAAAGHPILGDEIYGMQVRRAADLALASAEGDGAP